MSGTAPATGRLVGIDLARFVALAGMMGAHTLSWGETPPAAIVALVDGPPSTLFAVLGGVSVVLAARARLAAGDGGGALRATLVRGLVVALLGVLVAPLAPAVYVVLVPFGVAIALCGLLLRAPAWVLAALAAAIALGGGSVVAAAGAHLPSLRRISRELSPVESLVPALNDVLLTGVYPALVWLGYLLIGMLVGRGLLAAQAAGRERAMLLRLAAIGAIATGVGIVLSELGVALLTETIAPGEPALAREVLLANGYGAVAADPLAGGDALLWQLLAAPHTGTPADVARTAGIALVVIALLGLAVQRLSPRALRALEPVRAAGGAPLTVYIVHVLLLSVLGGLLQDAPGLAGGWGAWAMHVVIALALGALLAAAGQRGPFERLVGWCAERAAR